MLVLCWGQTDNSKPRLCLRVLPIFLPFPGDAGTQTSRSVNGDGDGIELDDGDDDDGDYEDDANCNISGRKDGELS